MQKIDYPLYEEHKKLHHQIIQDCNNLIKDINSIEDTLFEKELAKIIDEHLIYHVINEDKKITQWYRTGVIE